MVEFMAEHVFDKQDVGEWQRRLFECRAEKGIVGNRRMATTMNIVGKHLVRELREAQEIITKLRMR